MIKQDLNFGDLFDELAARIPERPAIIHGDTRLSWQEFDQRSNRLARRLIDAGLTPGDKVAFYLRNTPAYLELFAACAKARLTHVNVNYLYVDDELFHVLDNSDSKAVVFDADFSTHIQALSPRLDKVRLYLHVGEETSPGIASSYEDACNLGDGSRLQLQRSGEDLYFMYTGGTTGYPKAVMWQHKDRITALNIARGENAEAHAKAVAADESRIVLPACPLMHSTGLTTAISAMMAGRCVVLLPGTSFDAAVCLQVVARVGVQQLAIVGDAFSVPIIDHLREHKNKYDLSSVELIVSAGAMWSGARKQELLDYFPNAVLMDSLGSSEGSGLGSRTTTHGDNAETAKFQLGPHVKVFTEDFREVVPGSGEAGMIATAGSIPLGYYKDDAATAKTFPTINGVRYSIAGDWCQVESDGTMILMGRGNNCINSGGEKIYPEEVEEALKLHPEILDAAVVGLPDDRWGEAVSAVIRTLNDKQLHERDIKAHLSQKLARYKHPKRIQYITDEPIRHENGKVNYRYVRKIMSTDE